MQMLAAISVLNLSRFSRNTLSPLNRMMNWMQAATLCRNESHHDISLPQQTVLELVQLQRSIFNAEAGLLIVTEQCTAAKLGSELPVPSGAHMILLLHQDKHKSKLYKLLQINYLKQSPILILIAGSSGGTGALLAARVAPVGFCSDTGGSCRIPGALNGVAGQQAPST